MSWLTEQLTIGIDKIVYFVGNAIDSLTTSDSNRCTRAGYDLYACSCDKCIELDILREDTE